MKLNHQEIEKYFNNGALGSIIGKLGLSSYDLVDPLLEHIRSIQADLTSSEEILGGYEDQEDEITQLQGEIDVLQMEIESLRDK
jgi:type II secretory pathway component PulM